MSNTKSKYFASLDSIHDIPPESPVLTRVGSIDSVLVEPPPVTVRPNRRADSVDRYPLQRASYIEATKNKEHTHDSRGRTHDKKPTLR